MPDRVKETVFNILGCHYACPGALPPIQVADVFAGSGSLGLEALSRGADFCTFFERDPEALAVLRKNVESIGAADVSTVMTRDAWRFAVCGTEERRFELVFLDPPYRHSDDVSEHGPVRQYLTRLGAFNRDRPLVVLHHRAKVSYDMPASEPWRVIDRRTIGTSSISFFAS